MKYDLSLKEKLKIIASILGLFFCVCAIMLLILVNGKNETEDKITYREVGKIDNCTVYAVKLSYTETNFVMKCN